MKNIKKITILLAVLTLSITAFVLLANQTQAQEDYDIELVQNEPIFSAEDINFSLAAGSPLKYVLSLPGGYFAVSGALNTNAGQMEKRGRSAGYGQFLFDSNGNHIDTRHVAEDGGRVPRGIMICGKGWWAPGTHMSLVDDNSFIRDTADGNHGTVLNNPPMYYKATPTGLSLLGKAYEPITSPDFCAGFDEPRITDVVYAGGRAIGVKLIADSDETRLLNRGTSGAESNAIMVLPSMTTVNEISQDSKYCEPGDCTGTPRSSVKKFTPIVGVGDYLIAIEQKFSNINPIDGKPFKEGLSSERDVGGPVVYRVEGDEVVKVQDLLEPKEYIESAGNGHVNNNALWGNPYAGALIDPTNPNRVALVFRVYEDGYTTNGNRRTRDRGVETRIYTAGANGLELEKTLEHVDWPLAIMGDYIAYREGGDGTIGYDDLVVEKNGEKLNVQPLPHCNRAGDTINCGGYFSGGRRTPQPVGGVAFSTDGKLLVSGAIDSNYGSGNALWLYQIKDFEGAQPTSPRTPQTQTQEPQQVDINAIMEQYGIEPLRDYNFQDTATNYTQSFSNSFFNSNQSTDNVEQRTENTYTLNRPPQTIAEIRAFQCAYNIVCEGSIATTGYGNLGPKTQAKIDEVFGQDGSVNGVQTTRTYEEIRQIINQLLQQVAELRAQLGS